MQMTTDKRAGTRKGCPYNSEIDTGLMIYLFILSKYLDVSAIFLALIDIPLDTL